jgi:L-2-hydroxyglutarate oxidase LhgO
LERFDYCIIGAGVIGLATAYKLSLQYPKASILLIESHHRFGQETSSRNSEVIHAGIYYSPNSLKAELCRLGKEQLYDFCKNYSVPYQAIGKLIIASQQDELAQLENLYTNAGENGVELTLLNGVQCKFLEPKINAHSALYSATTGIIDSHTFMQTLLTLAEQEGLVYSPNTQFIRAEKQNRGFLLELNTADGPFKCETNHLINCAGLFATQLAAQIDALDKNMIPQYHYCRGHYYSYTGKAPFSHLIYPLPNKNTSGLGIHATLDLSGQVRFGPDTQYIDQIDYSFPENETPPLKEKFATSIRRYFPGLDSERLQASYSGIRPKLSGANEPAQDFMIQDQQDHQVEGLVNLFGIESPGLTSSLAIADRVISAFQ